MGVAFLSSLWRRPFDVRRWCLAASGLVATQGAVGRHHVFFCPEGSKYLLRKYVGCDSGGKYRRKQAEGVCGIRFTKEPRKIEICGNLFGGHVLIIINYSMWLNHQPDTCVGLQVATACWPWLDFRGIFTHHPGGSLAGNFVFWKRLPYVSFVLFPSPQF